MTVADKSSLRRLIFWVCVGCAGLALLSLTALLLAVRFAPKQTIPRLPLALMVEVGPVADRRGEWLIVERLREPAANGLIMEELEGSVRRKRRILNMLGGRGEWFDMPADIKNLVQPLCRHPDEHVRIAARKLCSPIITALAWNRREHDSGHEVIMGAPPGPGSWVPGRTGSVGLVALTYLGAGYDHRVPSKYKSTVVALIDSLLAAQEVDGRIDVDARDHAVATMALAEAYAMSNDPRLKTLTQQSLDWMVREADGGPEARWAANSDLAIWETMAMKSGLAGGLGAPLERMNDWRRSYPEFGLRWRDNGVEISVQPRDLIAQRALIGIFLGDKAAHLKIPEADLLPDGTLSECTNYWLYLSLFQLSGNFGTLSDAHSRRLIGDQSWDEGPDFGRMLPTGSTAANCLRQLTLEINYRYFPVVP